MKNKIIVENNRVVEIKNKNNESLQATGYAFSDVTIKIGDVLTLETLNRLREAEKEYYRLNSKNNDGTYWF